MTEEIKKKDSIAESLTRGRGLVVVLCAVVTTLAGLKGYQVTETEQAAMVDTIMALLSAVAGGVALVSKVRGMKK